MSGKDNKRMTLGAIAHFANGGAWNQTEYSDEGVPVVRVTDIKNETVDLSECKFLPHSALAKYDRHLLEPGDLVICTVGSHPTQPGSVVGRAAVMPPTARGALLNQNAVRIRSALPEVDQGWLGYLGRSKTFHDYIISCARGSANQVRMAIGLLKEMPVEVPPLPLQRRVAGILSAYDELIENGQRRIKILESMARVLYREWFVHFRFPGHENNLRVASAFGDIPKGWRVLPIDKLGKVVLGGTPSRSVNEYWEGGTIPWLKSGKLNDIRVVEGTGLITPRGLAMSATKLMPPRTVLIAITGAILVSFLDIEACANQSVVGIYDTSVVCPEYLHIFLSENRPLLELKMSGSAQQHINKEIVEQIPVLVPPEQVAQAFRGFVEPTYKEVKSLLFKIQNLHRTRNLLLPPLLSGQFEVEAA